MEGNGKDPQCMKCVDATVTFPVDLAVVFTTCIYLIPEYA